MERRPLLSLSLELFLAICDELDIIHLKQLRLTCKALGYALAAQVLRRLTISAKCSLKVTVLNLRCLTEVTPITAEVTRELKIDDLSSFYYGRRKIAGESITPKEESDMRRKIHTAITSLTAVTTLTWRIHATDPTWLQVIIWRSIKALPNLRHLTIHALYSKCLLDLHALMELESVYISGTPGTGADQFLDNLAMLYASSPRLISLDVSHSWVLSKANLHHLFSMCNDKSPPHRLRHLGLDSCFVRLDKDTLSHLRHLTSLNLELFRVDHHFTSSLAGIASRPDEIWRTFMGSGIHLEELRHDVITMSLIDYLSSYSGLKKLHLMDSGSDNWVTADPFFKKCLVNHVDTLEELTLIARGKSPWNFCSNNSMSITKCTKLKCLAMTVFLGGTISMTQRELPDDNLVKQFIDIALARLPHIQRLFLGGVGSENRPSGPRYNRYALGNIKYIPPASCQYLPVVTVFLPGLRPRLHPVGMFIGARDAGNGRRLMYSEKVPIEEFQFW